MSQDLRELAIGIESTSRIISNGQGASYLLLGSQSATSKIIYSKTGCQTSGCSGLGNIDKNRKRHYTTKYCPSALSAAVAKPSTNDSTPMSSEEFVSF